MFEQCAHCGASRVQEHEITVLAVLHRHDPGPLPRLGAVPRYTAELGEINVGRRLAEFAEQVEARAGDLRAEGHVRQHRCRVWLAAGLRETEWPIEEEAHAEFAQFHRLDEVRNALPQDVGDNRWLGLVRVEQSPRALRWVENLLL